MRIKRKYMKPKRPKSNQTKRPKAGRHHGNVKLDFYDHQPSSPRVGAVDATLIAGDAGRMSTPLGFGVLNLLPFDIW